MEHGTPKAYAAHRKAGEKPCDECRADANRRSKESRERKKQEKAKLLGVSPIDKAPRAKSLRDYADALKPADLSVYTHKVVLPTGETFSIHKDEESAIRSRDSIKSAATIEPFTPNPTTYWNSGEPRYDH